MLVLSRSSMAAAAALATLLATPSSSSAVAAGGCLPGSSVASCQGPPDDEASSAALGLLQFDAGRAPSRSSSGAGAGASSGDVSRAGAAKAGFLTLRHSLQRDPGSPLPKAIYEMNCTLWPTLCEAPFNCDSEPPTMQDMIRWETQSLASEDGQMNLKSWCLSPQYEDNVVKHCLKNHDLKTSAQVLFDWTVQANIDQLDGSYCFMEGHCSDKKVTYDTTMEETAALCDARYGHENWTSVTIGDLTKAQLFHPLAASSETGFHTRDITSVYGMVACAMGNYHCDVIYCRDTYCKKPEYQEKYGHFLKEFGYSS